MARIDTGLALLGASASKVAEVFVLAMVLHVTTDVFFRFAFDAPLVGTIFYVSLFYMTGIAFLPLAMAERLDAHT